MITIKNILAVRNDRFGEFLLNIPALRALKETYPEASLTLVVNPYVRELAQCIGFVDEIICWENKKHKVGEIFKFAQRLRQKSFALCLILNPSQEAHVISFLAGIPLRVGYNRKLRFLLNRKIADLKHLGLRHEVEYNLELAALIGAKTENKSLTLNIDDAIINGILNQFNLDKLGEFVALHPFTSDPAKEWPKENFVVLAKKLTEELNLKVIVVGGKEEEKEGAEYFGNLGSCVVDITGKTSLLGLAAVLKQARLLISCDSGPVHLAVSVGIPVLALFRNDIPGKSPKRWGPWSRDSAVIQKHNLTDITVDEVLFQAKKILTK